MYFVLIPISATTTTAPTTALSSTPSSNPSARIISPSKGHCAVTGCTEDNMSGVMLLEQPQSSTH